MRFATRRSPRPSRRVSGRRSALAHERDAVGDREHDRVDPRVARHVRARSAAVESSWAAGSAT